MKYIFTLYVGNVNQSLLHRKLFIWMNIPLYWSTYSCLHFYSRIQNIRYPMTKVPRYYIHKCIHLLDFEALFLTYLFLAFHQTIDFGCVYLKLFALIPEQESLVLILPRSNRKLLKIFTKFKMIENIIFVIITSYLNGRL